MRAVLRDFFIASMLAFVLISGVNQARGAECDSMKPLFPGAAIVQYAFTGDDAVKIKAVLAAVAHWPGQQKLPYEAVGDIVVVLDLTTGDDFLFLKSAADVCQTDVIFAPMDVLLTIFEKAGVPPRFGKTFYQLPDIKA